MIVSGYIFLYVLSNNYGISEVGNFTLIQAVLFTISTIFGIRTRYIICKACTNK